MRTHTRTGARRRARTWAACLPGKGMSGVSGLVPNMSVGAPKMLVVDSGLVPITSSYSVQVQAWLPRESFEKRSEAAAVAGANDAGRAGVAISMDPDGAWYKDMMEASASGAGS